MSSLQPGRSFRQSWLGNSPKTRMKCPGVGHHSPAHNVEVRLMPTSVGSGHAAGEKIDIWSGVHPDVTKTAPLSVTGMPSSVYSLIVGWSPHDPPHTHTHNKLLSRRCSSPPQTFPASPPSYGACWDLISSLVSLWPWRTWHPPCDPLINSLH